MSDSLYSASVPYEVSCCDNQSGRESAWRPLRHPLFRSLWIAAVFSNVGTWVQDVGEAWLMTSLTESPLLISLLQWRQKKHLKLRSKSYDPYSFVRSLSCQMCLLIHKHKQQRTG